MLFGNIFKRKRRLLARIAAVQRKMATSPNLGLFSLDKKLKEELDLVLKQEEIFWFQKSREDWIVNGDRNTSFFHLSTVIRRNRGIIQGLRNDSSKWVWDQNQLKQLVHSYFIAVCSNNDINHDRQNRILTGHFSIIKQSQRDFLN